jgi:hypothetical protein
MTLNGMRDTRLDLVARLYALEAEIANVEEAIAALDAVMPEARPTRRWRRNGSPIVTAVAAVLMERKHPVHAAEIVQLLASRGVNSKNPKASVASALTRLAGRRLARRVAPATYEWTELDTAEAIAERIGNIIPFVPRPREPALIAADYAA